MGSPWSADSTVVTADSTLYTADSGPEDLAPVGPGPEGFAPVSAAQYLALITSEHNQQPNFMAWVQVLVQAAADLTAFMQALPGQFDLDVAIGAQLDIVGLWVGQPRVVDQVLVLGFFGFADDEAALPFGELTDPSVGGRFYELGETYSGTTILDDETYLTIIRARIVRNQSNGTLSALEDGLEYIFGVPSSVQDAGVLSLNLTIASPITQTEQALLETLDILPRPAGVAIGSITYAP